MYATRASRSEVNAIRVFLHICDGGIILPSLSVFVFERLLAVGLGAELGLGAWHLKLGINVGVCSSTSSMYKTVS